MLGLVPARPRCKMHFFTTSKIGRVDELFRERAKLLTCFDNTMAGFQ